MDRQAGCVDAVLKQEESLNRVVAESYRQANVSIALNKDTQGKELQGKVRQATSFMIFTRYCVSDLCFEISFTFCACALQTCRKPTNLLIALTCCFQILRAFLMRETCYLALAELSRGSAAVKDVIFGKLKHDSMDSRIQRGPYRPNSAAPQARHTKGF
jgi:hypothetical protein